MEMEYQQNEIVWAKIIGYPWWPGAISQRVEGDRQDRKLCQYVVHFLGEDSQYPFIVIGDSCQLPCKKLAKFTPNAALFKQQGLNDRRLRESIEVAESIINGLSDLATELQKLQAKSKTAAKKQERKKTKVAENQRLPQPLFESLPSDSTSSNDQPSAMIPEPPAADPTPLADLSQTESELLHQLDSLDVNEINVTDLLESGLLEKLKRLSDEKASRYRRLLKKILLQKYFSKKTEPRRRVITVERKPRIKPIQKTSCKVKPVRPVHSPEQIEVLCVRKLYSILKMYNMEWEKARALSVLAVKKLEEEALPGTQRFISAFGSLLAWIKLNSGNPELAQQLAMQFSADNKLPEDEQTCDSKIKLFCETSSSVF